MVAAKAGNVNGEFLSTSKEVPTNKIKKRHDNVKRNQNKAGNYYGPVKRTYPKHPIGVFSKTFAGPLASFADMTCLF